MASPQATTTAPRGVSPWWKKILWPAITFALGLVLSNQLARPVVLDYTSHARLQVELQGLGPLRDVETYVVRPQDVLSKSGDQVYKTVVHQGLPIYLAVSPVTLTNDAASDILVTDVSLVVQEPAPPVHGSAVAVLPQGGGPLTNPVIWLDLDAPDAPARKAKYDGKYVLTEEQFFKGSAISLGPGEVLNVTMIVRAERTSGVPLFRFEYSLHGNKRIATTQPEKAVSAPICSDHLLTYDSHLVLESNGSAITARSVSRKKFATAAPGVEYGC